jgi:hypothetical protein
MLVISLVARIVFCLPIFFCHFWPRIMANEWIVGYVGLWGSFACTWASRGCFIVCFLCDPKCAILGPCHFYNHNLICRIWMKRIKWLPKIQKTHNPPHKLKTLKSIFKCLKVDSFFGFTPMPLNRCSPWPHFESVETYQKHLVYLDNTSKSTFVPP